MIVDDLDVICIWGLPGEADTPTGVYSNRPQPGSISSETLQSVSRRISKILYPPRDIDHLELATRYPLKGTPFTWTTPVIEEVVRISIRKRSDHINI